MNKISTFLLDEAQRALAATLFFLIGFSCIYLLKMLILAEYHLDGMGTAQFVVGSLVVGKVVVVLEGTSFGERFRHQAILLTVFWRSLIYTLMVFLVMVAENLIHLWTEYGALNIAVDHGLRELNPPRAVGISLCIFALFLGYNLLNEISRAVGRDRLVRFLFSRDGREMDLMHSQTD